MNKQSVPMYIAVWMECGTGKDTRGTWLSLPATQKEFEKAVVSINPVEGIVEIPVYNVRVPGLYRQLLLDSPLARVNFLASRLESLENEQIVKLSAIIDSDRYFTDLEQFIDYTYDHEQYTLNPNIKNAEDLGRNTLDSMEYAYLPKTLCNCISPYRFGAEIAKEQDGQFTALGYLTSDIGWNNTPRKKATPDDLNLVGSLGEDLYGNWSNVLLTDEGKTVKGRCTDNGIVLI